MQTEHDGHVGPPAVDHEDDGVGVVVVVVFARHTALDDHGSGVECEEQEVEDQADGKGVDVPLEGAAADVVLNVAGEAGVGVVGV